VFLQRWLMRQQRIQRPVQAVLVDLLGRHTQQVQQRAGFVELLCPVQLTGGSHSCPSTSTVAISGQGISSRLGAASLPESDPDPAGAATPAPTRGRRTSGCARREPASHRLPPIRAEYPETSCPDRRPFLRAALHSQPAPLIHRAQPGHHPLPRSALRAIALHQSPVSVALAVLPSRAAPQVHSPMLRIYGPDSRGWSSLHRLFGMLKPSRSNGVMETKDGPLVRWVRQP